MKCHQAAEKALKAAQFKVDASRVDVRNLVENSIGLDDSEMTQLASQLQTLLGDSTRMCYPDRTCYPKIPHDMYSNQMAVKALKIAKTIVERVRGRLV